MFGIITSAKLFGIQKKIVIDYVPSAENPTNVLTKALSPFIRIVSEKWDLKKEGLSMNHSNTSFLVCHTNRFYNFSLESWEFVCAISATGLQYQSLRKSVVLVQITPNEGKSETTEIRCISI